MNSSVFVSYCLFLTLGVTAFYGQAKQYFNRPGPYLERIENLKENIEQEKFRHLLTKHEFEDFRQYTATLLPQAIQKKGKGEKSFLLRSLASVVQKSNSDQLSDFKATEKFEKGRAAFRTQQFEVALLNFKDVVENHSYSAHVLNALFLQVEAYFQIRQYDQALKVFDKMLSTFPGDTLTGYAMLRVGKIYEFQDRQDDAVRLYETVLQSFPDRNLASLARTSLRSVEL